MAQELPPVKPSEMFDLIVKESDSVCVALIKLLKITVNMWKLVKFKYTPGGQFTERYKFIMCAAECPSGEDSLTSPNPPT
jgi:hypothetical protein